MGGGPFVIGSRLSMSTSNALYVKISRSPCGRMLTSFIKGAISSQEESPARPRGGNTG